MFNIFNKEYDKHKKKYLKYVSKEILEMVKEAEENGTKIEKEKANQRMNSYERNLIRPYLTDEHLIEKIEYFILQSGHEFRKTDKYTLDGTYNSTLKHKLIHLLLERFKKSLLHNLERSEGL